MESLCLCSRAVRGAITVESNSSDCIRSATIELLSTILEKNNIKKSDIVYIYFTLTSDLDAAFPAKFARLDLGFNLVPMMCSNELFVKDSLKSALRVLLVFNTYKSQDQINHIYLKGAKVLRPDLS